MTGRVAVVGSVNLDLTVHVHELPSPGQTLHAVSTLEAGGGKGANAALAAALGGAPTSLIAATGEDRAARVATADLAAAGVDLTGVARTPYPTGTAIVLVDDSGQNCIVVSAGANGELAPGIVARKLEEQSGIAVVLTNLEVPNTAVLAAADFAAARGATLIVNPAPARALPERLLRLRPVLTPNEDELERLTGGPSIDNAVALCKRTRAPVIVTRGARGAVLVTADGTAQFPAPPVAAVDTSGAGDVFNGMLAAHLAAGKPIADAVRSAVAAASESTQYHGARLPLEPLTGSAGHPA